MLLGAVVYLLTNMINGKAYVGKAKDVHCRMYEHRSGKRKRNGKMQCVDYAIQKYGWDNFRLELLETNIPEGELLEREGFYMKMHDTVVPNGYNILPPGVEVVSMKDPNVRARWEAAKEAGVLKMTETKQENREKRLSEMDASEAEALRYRLEKNADRERKRSRGEDLGPDGRFFPSARRRATWDRKRAERLARMSPEDARKAMAKSERGRRYMNAKRCAAKESAHKGDAHRANERMVGGDQAEATRGNLVNALCESDAESVDWF